MIEQLITDHLDLWSSAVRPKSSAGRGSNSKLELTGIKKLRELILELAVRGKLVPQDPNDEPASVLLERIAAEKARLVNEGKIKKSKPLPEITEEEKPFELPEGWGVVRLGEIGLWATGNGFPTIEQGFDDLEILFCKVSDMNLDGNERVIYKTTNTVSQETVNRLKLNLHQKGTVIFPKIGGAIATNKRRVIIRPTAIDNNCLGISPLSCVASNYLFLLLTSIKMEEYQVGTSVPAISQSSLELITLGLPPIDEQHRIVAKVDELMSLCDQLEQQSEASLAAHQTLVETLLATLTESAHSSELAQNWARLAQYFDSLFTTQSSIDALKQTILQLAVMGKLVPQDPNDEPASVLLERIAAEKARLIKEGKIKKEKPLPPISEEEKPFALPDGWEWCFLHNLVSILGDGLHGTPNYDSNGSYYFVNGNNLCDGSIVIKNETKRVGFDEFIKHKKELCSDTVLVSINGTIGNVAFYNDEPIILGKSACYFNLLRNLNKKYVKIILESGFFKSYSEANATGSTIKNLGLKAMNQFLIGLPPIEEQRNIVAKVDELMSLCDQLFARLQASQTTQLHLAEALVEGALN